MKAVTMLACVLGLVSGSSVTDRQARADDGARTYAEPTLEQRIDAAFIEFFPLYEMGRARFNSVGNPLNPYRHMPNGTPVHWRALVDHTARMTTTPNNDTLYSAAWLDLHSTPVRVHVPVIGHGRYWSIALLDAYTNDIAVLGRRSDGDGPVDVVVVGPDWQGDLPGERLIRAPTNDVQLLGRFLVAGATDIPAVRQIQDGIRIEALDPGAALPEQRAPARDSTDPQDFLAVVDEMLGRNPPVGDQAQRVRAWSDLGMGAGKGDFGRLDARVQAAWRSRLPVLHERLRPGLEYGARTVGGWSLPSPAVGAYGTDYALRAAVAFAGLGALPVNEAMYLNLSSDPNGKPLHGSARWKLVVPPIAAGAFWSVSMYEKDPDGRLFFADNPIHRYAVGDRTPGLQRDADGNIELLLQHDAPSDRANWLPTPAGEWAMTLRVYLPPPAMQRGEAALPQLVPATDTRK